MALDTFKARLKAKTKAAGVTLSNVRIDAIADRLNKQFPDLTEEADHDQKLDELDAITPFKEIASYDDYQRAKAAKEKKEKQQQQQQKEDDDPADPAPDADPDMPKWAKAMMEQNKTLMETVTKLQAKETRQSMQARLKETLKDVPEKFYRNWQLPEKEEDFEAFTERVTTEWTEFSKENPVQTSSSTHKPNRASGPSDKKPDEKELDAIIDNIT